MIDLMGSVTPNDAEIESAMQDNINSVWSPAKREQVLRTGVGKADLDAFFVEMGKQKAKAIADRNLLAATLKYEQATARLANYRLADGKPAQTVATTIQQKDKDGNLVFDKNMQPVYETQTIAAIAPLLATIPSVDDKGNKNYHP